MSTTKTAVIPTRLKGFEKPDTRSQFEGHLVPGRYVVEEYRENFPDDTTDFARIQAPTLGAGDTWICTRWKDQHYVSIEDFARPPPVRHTFEEGPNAVPEATLLEHLNAFTDFTYDLDDARYPYPLTGVNVPQAPPTTNNCCTFVEALLVRAWADTHPDFVWNAERHRQMMIMSSDDFFSPVTAAVESGMAQPVPDPDVPPHPWTIIQGWRHQWRSGHTFLIVDHHPDTDRVLTLEANSAFKLDGVGFRGIGNLSEAGGAPPAEWCNKSALWPWQRICSTYRFRQQGWLRVTQRSWSGVPA